MDLKGQQYILEENLYSIEIEHIQKQQNVWMLQVHVYANV
jgi:hypothetical protein